MTTHYVITTRMHGCPPEAPPHIFTPDAEVAAPPLVDVLHYLRDEIESLYEAHDLMGVGGCVLRSLDEITTRAAAGADLPFVLFPLPDGYTIEARRCTGAELVANGWRPGVDFAE